MKWIKQILDRRKIYSDLSEEIRQHLDERADELVESGMSRRDAEATARREFGNVTSLEERGREVWQWTTIESLFGDIRYALRQLRKEPSFAVVAVLILTLGIGATTSVFSVVNAVLLRPLPFDEPERLVRVANSGSGGLSGVTSRSSNLRDWTRMNHSFEDLAAYYAFFDYQRFTLTGRGEPEKLVGVGVTQTFLPMLGVEPTLGRNFVDEECIWNGRGALILTHNAWQRRFAADPGIVGQTITLNDQPTTVVGVLPASFDFASIFTPASRIDFLNPFPVSDETDRWGNTLAIIGRLRPGVTIGQAQAELDLINEQLAEADPNRWGLGATVSDLHGHISGRFEDALALLAVAVGLVLLITCTNLSNLLFARAASRHREIAVRSAIGAGRGRLIRQMLTESFVLAVCGGLLGVAAAFALTRAVAATQAVTIPLLASVRVDGPALVFALVLVLGTGVLFGLVPALQLSGSNDYDTLRDSGRGMSEGRRRGWLRNGLVVSEVALACMLLVGAGLLLRSFVVLLDTDLGFQPEQRVAWRVETNRQFETLPERVQFYEGLMHRIESIPGVQSMGLTDTLPLGRNRSWSFGATGVVYGDGERPEGFPRLVSPGYIGAMGIELLKGRNLTERDTTESRRVVLINEAAARRLWPGEDPIGREIDLGSDWMVAGVVANVRHTSLEEDASLELYLPMAQDGDWQAVDLVVRTTLPIESLVPSVRAALHEIDDRMATGEYQTLDSIVDRAASPRRFLVSLLGAFALAGVLLASLGIYGVMSYSVSCRTQEIGIRMALGASAHSVQLQVMRRALGLAAAGVLIGISGAFAVTRLMAAQLYGVTSTDLPTFTATIGLLFAVSILAGYLPALRASRVHPTVALREG